MRNFFWLAAMGLLCTSISFGAPTPAPSDESTIDHKFDALIQPNELRDRMKVLAAQPNHVGSPHDMANCERILTWFSGWGWDAHIETFQVLYPTPISETLELLGPKPYKATLQEPPIPGDSSATPTEPPLPHGERLPKSSVSRHAKRSPAPRPSDRERAKEIFVRGGAEDVSYTGETSVSKDQKASDYR